MIDHEPTTGTLAGRPPAPTRSQTPETATSPRYPYAAVYPAAQQSQAYRQPRWVPAAARMPKVQAQAIVKTLKRWTMMTSIGAFITLCGVAANNAVHASSSQTTDSGTSTPSSSSDQSSSSNYLGHSGSYNFGSSSSSQSPVSGSSAS